jgi:hypothetical protein
MSAPLSPAVLTDGDWQWRSITIFIYVYTEFYVYMYVNIYTYIYIRSTPRPVTADKWFSFNLPFQNEHKEIAPKISARRCLKKSSTCPPNLWYRIQNSRQGLHFQDLSSISVAFQHWERRAQTTDNTFMCYPEKVRAKRLHRSKD